MSAVWSVYWFYFKVCRKVPLAYKPGEGPILGLGGAGISSTIRFLIIPFSEKLLQVLGSGSVVDLHVLVLLVSIGLFRVKIAGVKQGSRLGCPLTSFIPKRSTYSFT